MLITAAEFAIPAGLALAAGASTANPFLGAAIGYGLSKLTEAGGNYFRGIAGIRQY